MGHLLLDVQQVIDIVHTILLDSLGCGVLSVLHDVVAKFVRVAVFQVGIRVQIRLLFIVKVGKAKFVSLTTWQRLFVGEQNVEDLHDGFVGTDPINLQHQIVHISHVLHPTAREQVGLLDVLEGLNAEDLDAFEVLD